MKLKDMVKLALVVYAVTIVGNKVRTKVGV